MSVAKSNNDTIEELQAVREALTRTIKERDDARLQLAKAKVIIEHYSDAELLEPGVPPNLAGQFLKEIDS